ncbi:site-specific recombinase XerD [Dysgonomonas sp. PFB1-18]|uniref:site-specific integrase n=1 Tax=unclassified Dysgonomonas TaxID=2630389 RepID=UPI002475D6F3|nr:MULTISPECIES: site-specific integrase [unclassified Dysgonomonas]MDH6311160.1 site-specific recombinase XerD [Dysgonomonas sp. PF1-14]MDH6341056.1 site-specific recombinase XerD [Dysgonomonas sp. PF1-16]MDH6382753.1 site-specific recombinase XerD [Dysgonomonas sp. PFB1-18]MDH6400032.1 site-specific recombinase XerD [Dysgonomonas sp. PF1-23]
MKSTFNILFLVRKTNTKKNGESTVMIRITIDGEATEFSSKISIKADFWDSKTSKVIGRTKSALEINKSLELIRADLISQYYSLLERGGTVTPDRLKNSYLGIEEKENTLISLFDKKIEQKKLLNQSNIISKETVDKYICTRNKLIEFLNYEYDKDDIRIKDVRYDLIRSYEVFLLTKGKCAHNTMVRHMRYLKQVITDAVKSHYLLQDPFNGITLSSQRGKRKYLTEPELLKLLETTFESDLLNEAKDVFIFCCFTGLAYIDVKNLKESDIVQYADGKKYIIKDRKKTGNESFIPLLDVPQRILNKYENMRKEIKGLLPVRACQNMNIYLKEIAGLCGIQKNLTTHCGRHTYATLMLTKGVSLESVSRMLGHTDIKTTQIYAKILNEKVIGDMNSVEEELNSYKF